MTLSRAVHFPGIVPNPCTVPETNRNWDNLRRLLNEIGTDITNNNTLTSGLQLFALTAQLVPGGQAAARLLNYVGGVLTTGAAITVQDDTTSDPWRGEVGYRGFAKLTETDSGLYSIVWMERSAADVWGMLQGPFTGGVAKGTVSHYADGVEPAEAPLSIYDRLARFPEAQAGSKFRASYDFRAGRYELVECQQSRWIATATAVNAYDALTSSVSISNVIFKSWAEYDIDPPTKPATATNTFGLSGSAGDLIHIQKEEDGSLWEIITGTGGGGGAASQLHRFRLYGSMRTGGNALAKRLILNQAANGYAEAENIRVFDGPYPLTQAAPGLNRGMWGPGIPSMEGWARKREGKAFPGGPDEYEIVWMEQYGRFVHFELLENMGQTFPRQAKARVIRTFGQGTHFTNPDNPADFFFVHDDEDHWHFALEGAQGTAIRNEYLIDAIFGPFFPYYQICVCQQHVLYGKAQLQADAMCPDDEEATITQFRGWTPSIFNQQLAVQPDRARNPFGCAAEQGDALYIVGDFSDPAAGVVWNIVQAEHKQFSVITQIRRNDTTRCIEYKKIEKAALMACEPESDWTRLICGEVCIPA